MKFKDINLHIILSHLASSEEINNRYNKFQQKNFEKYFSFFDKIRYKSLLNSTGILQNKEYHYDISRPGIALYGGHHDTYLEKIIKPIIKLKGKILQVKTINKNEYIGYNQTYKSNKKIKIAIVGIGYADGIFRSYNKKGYLYNKNEKFKIIGRISMDSITIDISNSKKRITEGKYITVIDYKNDINKMAKKCNTISNEILTSISNRVTRVYL